MRFKRRQNFSQIGMPLYKWFSKYSFFHWNPWLCARQVVYALKTHFWRAKRPSEIMTNAGDDLVFFLIYWIQTDKHWKLLTYLYIYVLAEWGNFNVRIALKVLLACRNPKLRCGFYVLGVLSFICLTKNYQESLKRFPGLFQTSEKWNNRQNLLLNT